MSGFKEVDSGAAASVFLGLYTLYLAFMVYVIWKKGFKTVYTFLLTFPLIRFGSQLCGMIFAKVGFDYINWLIAYLVLGAEGYFVLILAAFRFVAHAQKKQLNYSWLLEEGPKVPAFLPLLKRFTKSWSRFFHYLLIPANALVIAGGTMLTGVTDLDAEKSKVNTSKGLRTAGQAVFLLMTITVFLVSARAYKVEHVRNHFNKTVLASCPFLMVRGLFGILAIYITDMNYFQLSNYTGAGINHKLVIYEYVLSTTMEFLASCCLMSNFFWERRTKNDDIERWLTSERELEAFPEKTSR